MAAAALDAIQHAQALRDLEDVTTETTDSEFDPTIEKRERAQTIVTELEVDMSLQFVNARRTRRHGWLKLWLFIVFLTLYTVMMFSWMDIGMLGRQQRTWKGTLGKLRWVEPSLRRREGKGPEQVSSLSDYAAFSKAVVAWIFDNESYGYDTQARERGHVLKYWNVLRYLRVTRVRTRVLEGDDCPPPPWAGDAHHIFVPGRCYQFYGTTYGESSITEPDLLVDLDAGRAGALAAIDQAVADGFFSESMKESAIEVWAHNPQTRWSARLRLLFVFNVQGMVNYEGMRIFPVRLIPYGKGKDYFVMTLQIIYVLCLTLFLLLVLLKRFAMLFTGSDILSAVVSHFTSGWNLLDWTTTVMGFLGMIAHLVFVVSGGRDNVLDNTEEDFSWSWIPALSRYVLGMAAMFYSWKTLQYFEFDHNVGMLVKTLKLAWNTLTFYTATMVVIFVGYSIGGNIVVGGTGTPNFMTFGSTFQSCLQITTGSVSLENILPSEASHPATKVAVAIWYWTLILLVFFVLVNLFIAVILDAYSLLADPSLEALLTYRNLFLFLGEGIRVLKQTILSFVLRTPNGRITALSEKMASVYLFELAEKRVKIVSLADFNQRLSIYPGGENLIEWITEMCAKAGKLKVADEKKHHLLRKEARALKRKRRAEMLEKFGVAL